MKIHVFDFTNRRSQFGKKQRHVQITSSSDCNVEQKTLFKILITNSHQLVHKFTKITQINGKSGDVT
jgi:hypothetical protein